MEVQRNRSCQERESLSWQRGAFESHLSCCVINKYCTIQIQYNKPDESLKNLLVTHQTLIVSNRQKACRTAIPQRAHHKPVPKTKKAYTPIRSPQAYSVTSHFSTATATRPRLNNRPISPQRPHPCMQTVQTPNGQ